MAKTHYYTKTLLNTLYSFVNKNQEDIESGKFKYTEGIIYCENCLIGTDRRLLLKADIPDVPKDMKNKVYDNEENYITDIKTKDIEILFSVSNQTRTNSFVLNADKWDELYDKIKTKKRPKAYIEQDRISPTECVKLTDNLIVLTKDFNKFVKFCKKNNAKLIKYNDNSFAVKSNYMQLIGVNYIKYFEETEKENLNIYA